MKCPQCRGSKLTPHRPRPDLEIDGSRRTVRQRIDYRGALDQGLGGRVCVVARRGPFSGAVIVPDPS